MIELTEEKMKDVIEIANFEKDFIIDDICKFTISPVNGILHAVYFTVEEYDCPIEDNFIGYLENHYVEELKTKLELKFGV